MGEMRGMGGMSVIRHKSVTGEMSPKSDIRGMGEMSDMGDIKYKSEIRGIGGKCRLNKLYEYKSDMSEKGDKSVWGDIYWINGP